MRRDYEDNEGSPAIDVIGQLLALDGQGKKNRLSPMKPLLLVVSILLASIMMAGCSDTNDRGVIINHPFDIFGAAAQPTPVDQSGPVNSVGKV